MKKFKTKISTRDKNWNRDDTGRPVTRSSTWGAKDRCPKKNRRDWRKENHR